MSETLTLALFKSLENKTCKVLVDEITVTLKLAEVQPKERQPEGYECFTLLFTSEPKWMMNQGIYQVEFSEEQSYPLFLVPIDANDKVVEYEAIFSRQLEPA